MRGTTNKERNERKSSKGAERMECGSMKQRRAKQSVKKEVKGNSSEFLVTQSLPACRRCQNQTFLLIQGVHFSVFVWRCDLFVQRITSCHYPYDKDYASVPECLTSNSRLDYLINKIPRSFSFIPYKSVAQYLL